MCNSHYLWRFIIYSMIYSDVFYLLLFDPLWSFPSLLRDRISWEFNGTKHLVKSKKRSKWWELQLDMVQGKEYWTGRQDTWVMVLALLLIHSFIHSFNNIYQSLPRSDTVFSPADAVEKKKMHLYGPCHGDYMNRQSDSLGGLQMTTIWLSSPRTLISKVSKSV